MGVAKAISGQNFWAKLAIVVVFVFVFVFAAVVVAIDLGNDPASWHILSTSVCYQSDNPITYPEHDNDSDSDNELIKIDEGCKCEARMGVDWYVVEQDSSEMPILEAIALSHGNLSAMLA